MGLAFFFGAWFAVACVKNDAGSTGADAAIDSAQVEDPCDVDAFIASGGNGHACFFVSRNVCFPMCERGGCVCTHDARGDDAGIWKCTTDMSCVPESGPFDDAGDFDAAHDARDAG